MKTLLLSLSFFSIVLVSCDSRRVFDENVTFRDNIWERSNLIKFSVPIKDTVAPHNVYINVRNSEGYPYSNLYLFIHSTFPDGKKYTDTLECTLADATGKWLGSGAGDIYDNQILYKRNVRFRQYGTYTFEIEQAMRLEKLPLIMDAGMRIERAK